MNEKGRELSNKSFNSKENIMYGYILEVTQLITDLINIIFDYIPEQNIQGKMYFRTNWNESECGKFGLPYAITCYNNQIYILDDEFGNVAVTTMEGKFIKTIKIDDQKYSCEMSRGCIIYQSKIYVTYPYNKTINIFSIEDGKLIKTILCENRCYGINLYGSHIYISNIDTQYISIYTKEGKLVNKISFVDVVPEYRTEFRGLGLSLDGHEIYIVEYTFGDVLCLSTKGEYRYSFNAKSKGVTLSYPRAITSTKDSIYIGDCYGIHQFDKNDNFSLVKQFGNDIFRDVSGIIFVDNKCYAIDTFLRELFIFE